MEKETVNKDKSITLTSDDNQYSVTYVQNKDGELVDEWEDFMDKMDNFTCPMYDWY